MSQTMNNAILKSNYDAIKSLPMVKMLIRQNKKLNKENKSLRNLICSLPEFRPPAVANQCCCNANVNTRCRRHEDEVIIKTEPISPVIKNPKRKPPVTVIIDED